jgi:hypothetical protein
MAHLYWLVINTQEEENTGEVMHYLLDQKLVKEATIVSSTAASREKTIQVEISNNSGFLHYLRKRNIS